MVTPRSVVIASRPLADIGMSDSDAPGILDELDLWPGGPHAKDLTVSFTLSRHIRREVRSGAERPTISPGPPAAERAMQGNTA